MDGDVEAEKFHKGLVVAKAEECSEVGRVVLGLVDGRKLALTKDVAVDATSNIRELGNTIKRGPINTREVKALRKSRTGPWNPRKLGPNSPSY